MKRKKIYWACQLFGWGTYAGAMLLMAVIFSKAPLNYRIHILQFLIGANLLLVSHLLRQHIKKHEWVLKPMRWLLPRLLVLNLLAALLAQLLIHLQMVFFLDWLSYRPIAFQEIPVYVFNVMIMLWLWCLLYFGLHYFERYRNSEIEKWKLQASLRQAELTALKAQINPHFIFNALNNIRALTREDGERARQMITSLSDLLRYAVDMSRLEQVSVAREIEIVEDYLRLESIHYEERLQYQLEVAPECLALQIPPMSVQLLVENAIKHGISLLPGGGFINIQLCLKEEQLVIKVENSGQLQAAGSPAGSGGIGLEIIQERLRLLYGPAALLQITNHTPHAVLASLHIPTTTTAALHENTTH